MSTVMPQAASSSARARKSRRSTSVPPARRLRMVSSISGKIGLSATAGSSLNFASAHSSISRLTCVGGRKLPRSTRTALLCSTSDGCSTSRFAPNMAAPLNPSCTSFSAMMRLSTLRNSIPLSSNRSISTRPVVSLSSSDSINSHDAERFLLQRRLRVEHPQVHHDLARLIVDAALEFNPHPAVEFMAAAVASRHHCIGKGEERSVIAALFGEPLHIKIELAVEHRLQPLARDITLRVPIDSVTHFHVVSRHALRDRPRRPADAEKPTHHLLPGADLRERPVPARIEIDLQRLGMGINRFLFHVAADFRPSSEPSMFK